VSAVEAMRRARISSASSPTEEGQLFEILRYGSLQGRSTPAACARVEFHPHRNRIEFRSAGGTLMMVTVRSF
jgi:hypothetical protein